MCSSTIFPSTIRKYGCTSHYRLFVLVIGCFSVSRFILSLKTHEHLNVTTLRAGRVIGSPLWGFLPFRCIFSLTQNFPNPLIRTSSPFSSDALISSKRVSMTWADSPFVKRFLEKRASTIWAFVSVATEFPSNSWFCPSSILSLAIVRKLFLRYVSNLVNQIYFIVPNRNCTWT